MLAVVFNERWEIDLWIQMKKKITHKDANNLYRRARSQSVLYDEIKFDKNVESEDKLNTLDDSDIGYFLDFDLSYPNALKQSKKQKSSHFVLQIKLVLKINLVIIWMKWNQVLTHKKIVIGLIKRIIKYIKGCWNLMLGKEW